MINYSSFSHEQKESLADIYAILSTTEQLEKAYIRDLISVEDYQRECSKLINQFSIAKESVSIDWSQFLDTFQLSCPAAIRRLLVIGVPANREGSNSHAKTIAETVQHFITLMDSLKLNMIAMDQIYPLLTDLINSLKSFSINIDNLHSWQFLLRRIIFYLSLEMEASKELDDQQVRQLLFDLETAHHTFYQSLH